MFKTFCRLLISATVAIGLVSSASAQAFNEDQLLLLTLPLDTATVNQLWSGQVPANSSAVAANTIAQDSLTIPSLWWAQTQFGKDLLTYWVAFPGTDGTPSRVELLVDELAWSRATYFDRYSFVNHFGNSARDFGYNVRVFTWRGNLLGTYTCDFDRAAIVPADTSTSIPRCEVFLGSSPPGAFQGTTPFDTLNTP
ncbi:hypothetical protein IFO70_15030 [Phormidium tenue FACHB-886]|nr:hypothetical protein [Phormidium tenue FACHB-886]